MELLSYFTRPIDRDNRVSGWIRNLALVDWLMLAYLVGLNLAVFVIPPGPARIKGAMLMGTLLATYVALVGLLVRANLARQPWLKALMYRVTHFGCIEVSYFSFREFLPAVNPKALDLELVALDLKWFGIEPALYFDQFVTPFWTEWFSFFYYSYFLLLLCHVGPILFVGRNGVRIAELGLGLTFITCVGQTIYMFVPGFGPFQAIPEQFSNPLPSGFWFDLIMNLVQTSGALKDIFPSLHTAIPLFLFLFNFRHRQAFPYRYTWAVVCFFSANIIVSTMFLRWHYLIDVVAGVTLALLAYWVATRVGGWEHRNRQALGLGPSWPLWKHPPEPVHSSLALSSSSISNSATAKRATG